MSEAATDRAHDAIFRRAEAAQNQNTENRDSGVYATANAPQIVQVETFGRHGGLWLMFAFFLCAFVAAASAIGLWFTRDELRTVKAKYEVLQYDQQALKAQLVAKGLYEGTEH